MFAVYAIVGFVDTGVWDLDPINHQVDFFISTSTDGLPGGSAQIVQERLGHASVQMTLDCYSHVTLSMQEGAATILDTLYGLSLKTSAMMESLRRKAL